jgi:hypothetical protein
MANRVENEQSSYPQNPTETEQVKRGKGPQDGRSSVQPDAPKDHRKKPGTSPTTGPKRRRR